MHDKEAEIIAKAGMPENVTISTNMAGRGTDIQLGGNLDMQTKDLENKRKTYEENKEAIENFEELFVVLVEDHQEGLVILFLQLVI